MGRDPPPRRDARHGAARRALPARDAVQAFADPAGDCRRLRIVFFAVLLLCRLRFEHGPCHIDAAFRSIDGRRAVRMRGFGATVAVHGPWAFRSGRPVGRGDPVDVPNPQSGNPSVRPYEIARGPE
ncbi:Soluble lytic murein transglycosylase-related regulatory protein [Bifidobacterium longum subsp. longum KACC 91563]|nr:Soluble lytic murein transglycosylase-related regulatory protein [Bifidobacterium longum subsp. longum KACC 91563]